MDIETDGTECARSTAAVNINEDFMSPFEIFAYDSSVHRLNFRSICIVINLGSDGCSGQEAGNRLMRTGGEGQTKVRNRPFNR